MFNLKVKHKLLAIWLGSVIFALVLMAALFRYQIAGLHQQEARASIAGALSVLHQELEVMTVRINTSAKSLAMRSDIVASMNMIDRYQDVENYQASVFDGEKQQLARELAQHAAATGADILAVHDTKGLLAAFFISHAAGGSGAGYIVFNNGKPQSIALTGDVTPVDGTPALIKAVVPIHGNEDIVSYTEDKHIALSAVETIARSTKTGPARMVGSILVATVLDADFQTRMKQLMGMDVRIAAPDGTIAPPLPDLAGWSFPPDAENLVLDGIVNHANELQYTWIPNDAYFLGAVKIAGHHGADVGFVFAQRKDALQSVLTTFQNSVILVLMVSGLLVIPIGIFFLNRSITRPVEDLMTCAEQLSQGQDQDMSAFTRKDEFSELAYAFQDMATAVRARENALRASQNNLKNAQRIARLGSWQWDVESGQVECSDEVLAILGRTDWRCDDIETFLSCVHPDDLRSLNHRLAEAAKNKEPFSIEHRVVLENGQERFVIQTGEAHSDADALRLTVTLQDITERHMLEQAKSELVSTVSHELRTPLTSIIGTLGLALGGVMGELPDRLRGMLTTADKNAKRLSSLINDLLDVEKIANGALNFEFRPLTVATIVRKAQAANQAYAEQLGVAIRIDGEIPEAKVQGDADRLAQVMANLLSNACKFTPKGLSVTIRVSREHDTIAIAIADPGPGIPEAFEAQVFERFAQADQSLTRQDQRGGTGLGLAITKAIVDIHHGQITFTTVRAPEPGHGTTFTVVLPEWRENEDAQAVKA